VAAAGPDTEGFVAACLRLQLPVAVAKSWWEQDVRLLRQHLLQRGMEEEEAAAHDCGSLAEVGGVRCSV
jgi:hypothetical protein